MRVTVVLENGQIVTGRLDAWDEKVAVIDGVSFDRWKFMDAAQLAEPARCTHPDHDDARFTAVACFGCQRRVD